MNIIPIYLLLLIIVLSLLFIKKSKESFEDTEDNIQLKFQEREALQQEVNDNPNMMWKKKQELLDRIDDLNNTFDFTNYTNNDNYKPLEESQSAESVNYDVNNFNVDYHESSEILEKEFGYGLDIKNMIIYDPQTEKVVSAKVPMNQTLPIYNSPGKYKYGVKKYIPTYTDSVYLSPIKNIDNDTNIQAYDADASTFVLATD
tara:strand:+ start:6872 stop:7477 length:606 start_codon:yes stop_codon:yes gene_type:complete